MIKYCFKLIAITILTIIFANVLIKLNGTWCPMGFYVSLVILFCYDDLVKPQEGDKK